MTEMELSDLYTRLALQFDSVLEMLVSKNLVFLDFVPGIRKDFYDSLNEEKRKDFERIFTYTEIIRRYIRGNANNGPISLTQLAKKYSEESTVCNPKLDAKQKYTRVFAPVGNGREPRFRRYRM